MKLPIKEKEIEQSIFDYLELRRILIFKVQNTGIYDSKIKAYRKPPKRFRSGVADLIGIYNGRPLAIEVKRPGENPTIDQINFLQDFKAAGGIAFVARSIEDVEYHLTRALEPGAP